jgi:hypothetical protein
MMRSVTRKGHERDREEVINAGAHDMGLPRIIAGVRGALNATVRPGHSESR